VKNKYRPIVLSSRLTGERKWIIFAVNAAASQFNIRNSNPKMAPLSPQINHYAVFLTALPRTLVNKIY